MGTRIDQATANTALHERAAAFGLKAQTVDGLDVEHVADAARRMIEDARAGKPGFLAIDVYRFYGHARKDKSPYRDPEEEEAGRDKDSVELARENLLERGLLNALALEAIDDEINAEMDATISFTMAQSEPAIASMFRDVYALDQPEPEPVQVRIDRVLARE
jgi:pyruvate dehydrogenase E1 component alpha subunit